MLSATLGRDHPDTFSAGDKLAAACAASGSLAICHIELLYPSIVALATSFFNNKHILLSLYIKHPFTHLSIPVCCFLFYVC